MLEVKSLFSDSLKSYLVGCIPSVHPHQIKLWILAKSCIRVTIGNISLNAVDFMGLTI